MPGCNALSHATVSPFLLPDSVQNIWRMTTFMDVLWMTFFRSFPSVYGHPKFRFISSTCQSWAGSQNNGDKDGEPISLFPLPHSMMASCIHNSLLVPLHTWAWVSSYKQGKWDPKVGLFFQMSKACVEMWAVCQIPCPVHTHSTLELATLINSSADLQLLMRTISSHSV